MKTKDNPLYAEFVRLIELPKLEPADVQHLTAEQLQEFKQLINLRLNHCVGERYEKELAHYQAILEPPMPVELTPAVTDTHEFDYLLTMDKIERSDLQHLSPEKKKEFGQVLSNKMATATGVERDAFTEKIGTLLDSASIWETNHAKITSAITNFAYKYGNMPTKAYILKETGLSKATVYKHMESLKSSPLLNEQNQLYTLMAKQVLGKVLQSALHGDMGAAKLYLNSIGKLITGTGNDIVINNQNNVQINRTILNQQTIQQLKPEQLQQIEEIIKRSLAEKNDGDILITHAVEAGG